MARELPTGRPLAGNPGDQNHRANDRGGDPDGDDGVPVERAEHSAYHYRAARKRIDLTEQNWWMPRP